MNTAAAAGQVNAAAGQADLVAAANRFTNGYANRFRSRLESVLEASVLRHALKLDLNGCVKLR